MATALRALYESTGGALWTDNAGWPPESPCSAHGVGCDGSGRVRSVVLKDNGLQGTLPAAVAMLHGAYGDLDFSHNAHLSH